MTQRTRPNVIPLSSAVALVGWMLLLPLWLVALFGNVGYGDCFEDCWSASVTDIVIYWSDLAVWIAIPACLWLAASRPRLGWTAIAALGAWLSIQAIASIAGLRSFNIFFLLAVPAGFLIVAAILGLRRASQRAD